MYDGTLSGFSPGRSYLRLVYIGFDPSCSVAILPVESQQARISETRMLQKRERPRHRPTLHAPVIADAALPECNPMRAPVMPHCYRTSRLRACMYEFPTPGVRSFTLFPSSFPSPNVIKKDIYNSCTSLPIHHETTCSFVIHQRFTHLCARTY